MAATGWLAHSTRAALTGLRKRGMILTKGCDAEGRTAYRLTDDATTLRSGDGRRDQPRAQGARSRALASLDLGDLRIRWRQHLRTAPPPHLSRPLMVRLLAYRIQAKDAGRPRSRPAPGCSIGSRRSACAGAPPPNARPSRRRRPSSRRSRRPGFGPARCWCGSSGVRSTPSLWWRVGLPGGRRPMPACRRSLVRSPAPAGTDPASSGCGTR